MRLNVSLWYRHAAMGLALWSATFICGAEFTARWIGQADGLWSDAANWDTGTVPDNTESDVFHVIWDQFPVRVAVTEPIQVQSFTFVSGGMLELPQGESLRVRGAFTGAGGELTGAGVLELDGEATLNGPGPLTVSESTVRFQGETLVSNVTLVLRNGAELINGSGAVFELVENANITSSTAERFRNEGTFRRRSQTGRPAGNVQARFENAGLAEIEGPAAIDFQHGFTQLNGELRLTANAGAGGFLLYPQVLMSNGRVEIANGVLSGDGFLSGTVFMKGGTLLPGRGRSGILYFNELELGTNAVTRIQMRRKSPSEDWEESVVADQITLGGVLELVFPPELHAEAEAGGLFRLMRAHQSLAGSFGNAQSQQRLTALDEISSFLVQYGPGSQFQQTVYLTDYLRTEGAWELFLGTDPALFPPDGSEIRVFPDAQLTGNPESGWQGAVLTMEMPGVGTSRVVDPSLHVREGSGVSIEAGGALKVDNVEIGILESIAGSNSDPGKFRIELNGAASSEAISMVLRQFYHSNLSFQFRLLRDLEYLEPTREARVELVDSTGRAVLRTRSVEYPKWAGITLDPPHGTIAASKAGEFDCSSYRVEIVPLLSHGTWPYRSAPIESYSVLMDPGLTLAFTNRSGFHICNTESCLAFFSPDRRVFTVTAGEFTASGSATVLPCSALDLCIVRTLEQLYTPDNRPGLRANRGLAAGARIQLSLFHAFQSWMERTEEGRRLAELYWRHTHEVAEWATADPGLATALGELLVDLQSALFGLFSGQGGQLIVSQTTIQKLNSAWDKLMAVASPELKQGLETERERFGGFQEFLGKNLLQATALLSLESPTAPFIYASNPRSGDKGFALDANYVPGRTYSLWQTVSLGAGNWQPVLDAVTTVDGFTVTLTDTNAAQSRIFYQVQASPANR